MHDPKGPQTPFQLLFSDEPTSDTSLPDSFRAIYPGDWQLHSRNDRPFVFSNFAQSRDGRDLGRHRGRGMWLVPARHLEKPEWQTARR